MPIKNLSYLCFIQYFIYRNNVSDYYVSEPMDIEGEAVCAVGPQLVTAEGEQGAGVDDKRIFSHLEADFLLLSDDGEPMDDQEQFFMRPMSSQCRNFQLTPTEHGFP